MLSMGIWARSRLHPAMTRTRNRGGNRGKPSSESWPELPKALPCRCSSWVQGAAHGVYIVELHVPGRKKTRAQL